MKLRDPPSVMEADCSLYQVVHSLTVREDMPSVVSCNSLAVVETVDCGLFAKSLTSSGSGSCAEAVAARAATAMAAKRR